MPIEFHCTQCGQLLRVPDESAGKSARCPKCQTLMTIPAGSPLAPPAGPPVDPFALGSSPIPQQPTFPAPPTYPAAQYPTGQYPTASYPPPPKPSAFSPAPPPPNPYASSPMPAGYAPPSSNQTPMLLAVGSLVTAVLGLLSCGCCLFMPFPPIALLLGIAALVQKPDPQARVMAIIGIVLAGLSLLLFAIAVVFGFAGAIMDPQLRQGVGN